MDAINKIRNNWLPLSSAFILVFLAAYGIYRADLTDGLEVLFRVVPVAFISGILLSVSVFSRRTSLLFSLVYAGFFIFMFAEMNIFFYFGLLAGSAVLLALGADLLLAPALMTLVIKRQTSPMSKPF